MQPEIRYTTMPAYALDQNRVLRNTYWLLGLTMIPTVIGAFVGMGTNFAFLAHSPLVGSLVMLAVMFGLMFAVSATRNSSLGVLFLLIFTGAAGWFLGPILQVALHLRNGPELIGMAAGGTGAIFLTLAGIATVTKRDFGFMGNFLFIGLILLIIASIANIFLHVPAASLAISAIAILIFAGYILFDVSQIVHGGETNYIMATLTLYLDIYNIFVNLLSLLMALSGDRD
ncbi:MAG TPA: Bax inhibitor-1/YccA family protein [Burkholderiales bacterium]|nr:Bax inhibitor-1/YccA family protein [Burkholderiales bacterium]